MTPRVSVVIPTYNCAQYIAETLQSVLDQGYPNLEIIVVDDGSTDNTREVVAGFRSDRITYLYQSNSGGPSRPRNVGIAHAQGQFIALFDSDDIMLPDKIAAAVEFLAQEPQLGLVFSNCVKCDERGRVHPGTALDSHDYFWKLPKRRVGETQNIIKGEDAYETLILDNYIGTSSVVIPKEVFKRVGTFDESVSGPEDFDMWLRITSAYDIGFLDIVGYRYRIRHDGITARGEGKLVPHRIRVMRKQLEGNHPHSVRKKVNLELARHLFALGYHHQSTGEMRLARKYYILSLKEAFYRQAWKGILVTLLGAKLIAILKTVRSRWN